MTRRECPGRTVYGSNCPLSDRVAPYATVHRVIAEYFTSQERAVAEKDCWRNSRGACRWLDRGAAAKLGL
jgi:hypothetical protein